MKNFVCLLNDASKQAVLKAAVAAIGGTVMFVSDQNELDTALASNPHAEELLLRMDQSTSLNEWFDNVRPGYMPCREGEKPERADAKQSTNFLTNAFLT